MNSEQTDDTLTAPSRKPDWFGMFGPYLGLLLVFGVFCGLTWWEYQLDAFLNLTNLRYQVLHYSVLAIVAIGMTWIMISGGIDLSVGNVVSLVTVVTFLVYRWSFHALAPYTFLLFPELFEVLPDLLAVAAGLATGLCAGAINGIVITKFKVLPFVATLGMMGFAYGLGRVISENQPLPFPVNPDESAYFRPPIWVSWFSSAKPVPESLEWLQIGYAPWSVILLAVISGTCLGLTVLGRYCYAIGSNEATAKLCGINVDWVKLILYSVAGLITGWAGIVQTARSNGGNFDAQEGLELQVIAAVVIGGGSLNGGQGTINGTIAGVLLLAVLENGCSTMRWPVEVRFIIIGAILILVSALNSWRQQRSA